ncbi:MAG: hypothetical protein AB7I19_18670, partial [Planctomycetota bacterium]
FTDQASLRAGRIDLPVRTTIRICLLLGATYGVFMGLYGALRSENAAWLQILTSALKVPLLFLLTLVVTVPSLYVVSALAGSRLRFLQTLRLLLVAIAVHLALLASFGPVTGFFTLSTESYPFMVLLNVVFFAAGGFAGLRLLERATANMFEGASSTALQPPPTTATTATATDTSLEASPTPMPQSEHAPRRDVVKSQRIFAAWLVIYSIVGAQMGWILRPFIGSPDLPFTLFRERDSSFFGGVWTALQQLFR